MKKLSPLAFPNICIAVTIIIFFILHLKLYLETGRPLNETLLTTLRAHHSPDPNHFGFAMLYGIRLDVLLALIILLSIILSAITGLCVSKRVAVKYIQIPLVVTVTVFALVAAIQLLSKYYYLKDQTTTFHKRSVDDKYITLFNTAFVFAQIANELYPGEHSAQIISDLNFESGDYASTHRVLAYFLYPIDIRNIRPAEDHRLFLIFDKDNAAEYVPADYPYIYVLSEKNIIAGKEPSSL